MVIFCVFCFWSSECKCRVYMCTKHEREVRLRTNIGCFASIDEDKQNT